MRTLRIAVFVSVVCLALMPFAVTRSRAERSGGPAKMPDISGKTTMLAPASTARSQQQSPLTGARVDAGQVSPEVYAKLGLGIQPPAAAQTKGAGATPASAGLPSNMAANAALSTAVATTVGKGFNEVDVMGDWDGKEDDTADHGGKILDASNVPPAGTDPGFFLTRVAVSEHTMANGFPEDIFYQGDSLGNVYVASTTNLTQAAPTPTILQINLPTILNAFGTLNSSDQVVITGLAVSPVVELGSFSRVNGSFATDFPDGTIGEILYVAFEDTGSGFRLLANGTLIRSGVLAFPISDTPTPGAAAPPGRLSSTGFPVTVGGSFGVAFSVFSNLAGCAVDDDGSVYFQQVDLTQFTGGNIVKLTSKDSVGSAPFTCPGAGCPNQDRGLATSGFLTISSLNPAGGNYGTASGPSNQITTATNYSGTSTFFGNAISLATGAGNTVYAAMARSNNPGDSPAEQATEGLFQNAATLGATPAMIITMVDALGSFDNCSAPNPGVPPACPTCGNIAGTNKVGDGFADVVPTTTTNWTAFVLGNGPDTRAASGTGAAIFGTTANTLKLDMLIDYSVYSGLAVNEENAVYVLSGAAPANVGSNPSPTRGEVLMFEDNRPGDRKADYIDFRGDQVPNPPLNGGNVGDGDSDRFDHIFYQAPLDVSSLTPTGLSGLSRGFLRYTNRLAPTPISAGVDLGTTLRVEADDATTGAGAVDAPILFEGLDPSHQVAGGDDQVSPFTGDDNDGAGNPAVPGALNGGFEFTYANPLGDVFTAGAACGTGNGVWNGFFLNSNGSVSFGAGDTDNTPSNPEFRSGVPKIAPAWADLNPAAKAANNGTFPVQAVGFSGVNAFKVRYINVPQFSDESCASANATGAGMTNTFSITMYDDGTGIDENANQPLNPANPIGNNAVPFDLLEGSTDKRFVNVTTGAGQALVAEVPRPDGSGLFTFNYGRMDLLGTEDQPVIVGYSIGKQNGANPTGLCEVDLGTAAVASDSSFGNIQGQLETRWPTFIGDGTEPEIHELFHNGNKGKIDGITGIITLARSDFDLKFEGNGNAAPDGAEPSRDKVGFFGTTCQLPANPTIATVLPNPFVTTPSTTGLINAYAPVTVNLLGQGFFPNQSTTVCQTPNTGDATNPDTPSVAARPGKTGATTLVVNLDTNGDGVPDLPVTATNVTTVSRNLVTAVLPPLPNASGTGPGSWAPFLTGGGVASFVATSNIGVGNNNIFNVLPGGGFNRTSQANFDTGPRAPVVVGSSPVAGDSSVVQSLTISGFDFNYSTTTLGVSPPGTILRPFVANGVFAVQRDNPATIIQATNFNVLNNTTITASFNFNNAPVGTQFLIFVKNAAGNSRNALTPPGGATPAGNEQGNLVLFTVNDTTNPVITCPANVTVNGAVGASSANVSYPAPVATDNQTGVTVSCTRPSGSSFNVGTTPVTCTATDTSNNTASCGFNVTVVGSNSMHFSSATYGATEGCISATVTVQRDNGSASGTSSVDLSTSDGSAVQKNDYGIRLTTVTFSPGETSKNVSVIVNDDGFVEGPETVNLSLTNPQNGFAGNGPVLGTLTITDDDLVPSVGNINDSAGPFVCQQYHDFLNRDSDAAGAAFWTSQITACGADAACIALKRINVSAAFFLSIEFQETGADVLRVQRAAFGKKSADPLTRVTYLQYMRDSQQVGQGVVVGQAGFQAILDANKLAYVNQTVSSSAFITQFPLSQTASTYVDALFTTAAIVPTAAERNAAITAFGAGGTAGRAAALQSVADSNSLRQAELNPSFVLMEYFGYLRRNPTDAPDSNDAGYQFWLTKLNGFGGNFVNAELVKAFITSSEYRQRFGP